MNRLRHAIFASMTTVHSHSAQARNRRWGAPARSARSALILLAVLVSAAHGNAAPSLDEARALYHRGNFLEAARLARNTGSAEGYALAAQAVLVDAVYEAPQALRQQRLEAAAEDADRALELDPNNVDALLRLAITLGHMARLEDPVSAYMKGYAQQGRELLGRVLALQPDHPWGIGLLGMWHLQVVRRAGDALAGSLEASRERGLELCARAIELDPDLMAIRYGCALSMIELDQERYRQDALAQLRTVVSAHPEDAAGRLIRRRAWAELRNLRQS